MKADDFFNALFDGGYVQRFDWKHTALETAHYSVGFACNKCTPVSWHIFDITVTGGVHTISNTSVFAFCASHGIHLA